MKYEEAITVLAHPGHEVQRVRRAAWPEGVYVRRTRENERGALGTYVHARPGKKDTHFLVTAEDVNAEDWSVENLEERKKAEAEKEKYRESRE
jgi:hypothetical protein